jgi:hypothetical protein
VGEKERGYDECITFGAEAANAERDIQSGDLQQA